ncbi:MAG: hypothetical protein H6767_03255 [Candidatus Peribacteria bacterium]|nr:MAG: hypothetical protein H6767_03255 [Candidatus Peribacteria bacterium]
MISLGASLEKVQHKSSSLQEKLSLLEVISQINERLKERATNEVEDEFIL